jgi:hypothetical protein
VSANSWREIAAFQGEGEPLELFFEGRDTLGRTRTRGNRHEGVAWQRRKTERGDARDRDLALTAARGVASHPRDQRLDGELARSPLAAVCDEAESISCEGACPLARSRSQGRAARSDGLEIAREHRAQELDVARVAEDAQRDRGGLRELLIRMR